MQSNAEMHRLMESIRGFLPDLEMSLDDIKNPSPAFASNFYQAVLVELGVNKSSLLQMSPEQMQCMNYYDMYQPIGPVVNLMEGVRYFMKTLGTKDFGLSDHLNPNPKRNAHLMGVLMNFLTYCDKKITQLDSHFTEMEKRKTAKQELLKKIETLKEGVNQRLGKRHERAKLQKQVLSLFEENKRILEQLVKKQITEKEKASEANIELNKLEEEINNNLKIRSDLEGEIKRQELLLVKSPGKLKSEIERMNVKKEHAMADNQQVKNQIEEKRKLKEFLSKQLEDQNSRRIVLNEIIELYKELCSVQNELQSVMKEGEPLIASLGEKEESKMVLAGNMRAKEEELNKIITLREEKLLMLRKQLEELTNKKVEEEESHIKNQEMKHEGEKLILEMKRKIEELQNEYPKYRSFFKDERDKFQKEMDILLERYEKELLKLKVVKQIQL